jgi:hypothetical protein
VADDNPVYLHLTRHSRWPTHNRANQLGVAIALAAGLLGLLIQLLGGGSAVVLARLMLLTGTGIAMLAPLVALTITALATGQDISSDAYDLLLLSKLSDEAIFAGHTRTAYQRLYLLRAVPAGILVGICPIVALALYGSVQTGSIQPSVRMASYSTLFCGPVVLVPIVVSFIILYELAIRSGVWIGLRWGQLAPNMLGMVASMGIMLMIPTLCWLAPFVINFYSPWQGADVSACLLWPGAAMLITGSYWLSDVAQQRAYRIIQRRRAAK